MEGVRAVQTRFTSTMHTRTTASSAEARATEGARAARLVLTAMGQDKSADGDGFWRLFKQSISSTRALRIPVNQAVRCGDSLIQRV
jgi:hypothetical protein